MAYFSSTPRALACAPLCLAVVLSGCNRDGHPAGNAEKEQPPTVATATVQRGTIAHTLSLAGEFQAYQTVDVHAKVSGYIRRMYVDIGDRVHAGQTLAVLEVPELNAQYRASRSESLRSGDAIEAAAQDVARAKSLHASVQANYDRLHKASDQQPGLIAAQELDNARGQADASQAQVDAALAALAGAKQAAETATADQQRVGALQSYTTVTAPLDGVVSFRFADTGALIQAGTNSDTQSLPLIKLSQSDVLRLRVPVPEDAIKYIHVGDAMSIRVDALDRSFDGKVVRFTRDLDPVTRTMETEVDVPNRALAITPGMYANTYLTLAHADNVLTLPSAAVEGTGASGTVWVLNASNALEQRPVKLGLRGSVLVEVTEGLQSGDRVALGETSGFQPGERVTPRPVREPANDRMREEGGMTDTTDASAAANKGGQQ